MRSNEAHLYLIACDIADSCRLQKVHAFLRRHAMPVQYSVFLARLSERRLVGLLAELARRIDARSDDVRACPIRQDAEAVTMGRRYLPPGVLLADPRLSGVLRLGGQNPEQNPPDGAEKPAAKCDKEEDRFGQ